MRTGRAGSCTSILGFVLCGLLGTGHAEDDARLGNVVAHVGTDAITVAAAERRMAQMPDFQLATFGDTEGEIRRAFVEQVMVKDALLAAGAYARKLEQSPGVRERIDEVLRAARIDALKSDISVNAEEIAAFYAANMARFNTPERIGVYRILCPTREEAASVLTLAKGLDGVRKWNDLARDRSIDKATSLRGGNLGFLAADGSSNEVSVKADPALFAAASRVKDGEMVPEPVPEGTNFAVVWRRGSTPAVHRTLQDEESAIRQVIARQKLENATRDLIKRLREERKVEESPQLIDIIEVDSIGEVTLRKRPGAAPRKPELLPTPSMTPQGLR